MPATTSQADAVFAAYLAEHPGLTHAEAVRLLAEVGPNELTPRSHTHPVLATLVAAVLDPMALLLLAAMAVYVATGEYVDATVALIGLVPVIGVNVVLELRAERTLEALRERVATQVAVWRQGERLLTPVHALVPGDLCFLQEGDVVPADAVMVAGSQLAADEASLTGESLPVHKAATGEPEATRLLAGSSVLSGRALAQVTATGAATQYGRIGMQLGAVTAVPTPFQRMVQTLVRRMAVLGVAASLLVAALAYWRGEGLVGAVNAGIGLAVAAMPEEFPMVFTLYLTFGAWRLAQHQTLVRRLAAVETLGSADVVCTDKTGTVTQGRLAVTGVVDAVGGHQPGDITAGARAVLEAAVLASEPDPFDLLDVAVQAAATASGLDVAVLHADTLVHDYPFDPFRKYVSHVWQTPRGWRIAAKGALEGMLEVAHCDADAADRLQQHHQRLADQGMRVIAVAEGVLPAPTGDRAADEAALQLVGLVAFADPVREGVEAALRECREAGIRVVLITGDHPVTAHAVAEVLGIEHAEERPVVTGAELAAASPAERSRLADEATLFARVTPDQKLEIVEALRQTGHVVAMTGDGINDAPALRAADIGIAMGQRGTEVARSAAAMVLLDDNFATIVRAIRQGRRVFGDLQRAFLYLLAFHPPLLAGTILPPLLGLPLLLYPLHIILLELLLHPLVSLVFQADPEPAGLMQQPPRNAEQPLVNVNDALQALALGAVVGLAVVGLYAVLSAVLPGSGADAARGAAFVALVVGQLALLVVGPAARGLRLGTRVAGNRVLAWSVAGTLVVLPLLVLLPPAAAGLHFAQFAPWVWLVAGGVGIGGVLAGQAAAYLVGRLLTRA